MKNEEWRMENEEWRMKSLLYPAGAGISTGSVAL